MTARYSYKNIEFVTAISVAILYEGDIILYPVNEKLDAIRIIDLSQDEAEIYLDFIYHENDVPLYTGNAPQYEFMLREKADKLLEDLKTN